MKEQETPDSQNIKQKLEYWKCYHTWFQVCYIFILTKNIWYWHKNKQMYDVTEYRMQIQTHAVITIKSVSRAFL